MSKVENGSEVRLHYKGTLDDGTVFDDSLSRDQTLDFKMGAGNMVPGFEEEITGMLVGESRSFRLENAYGDPNQAAVVNVPKSAFPKDFEFIVGGRVMGKNTLGKTILATISSVDDDEVVLDHNHPLSGKDLNFEVELVEVKNTEATSGEEAE